MNITHLVWDPENTEHIAKHQVIPEEVEEVCSGELASVRVERGRGFNRIANPLYYVLGRTAAGRYLFVVVRWLGRGQARVITARDQSDRERRRYEGR